MRIAMVNIYSEPFGDHRTGGLITSAVQLKPYGFHHVAVGKKRNYHCSGYEYIRHLSELNKFDFVIFSSAGSNTDKKVQKSGLKPWWFEQLKSVNVPFAVQAHSELDEKDMVFKDEFFNHPMFRLFLPIVHNIWENMPNGRTHAYLCHKSTIERKNFTKRNLIVSTGRLTSTKRIKELVMKSPEIKEAGFLIDVYGPQSSYFYFKDLMLVNPGFWCYKGSFKNSEEILDEVLGSAMYHWNVRCFKRGKRKNIEPRLEIATVEALERGCIPIVHKDSTPKAFHNSLVCIDGIGDLNDLIEALENRDGDVDTAIEIFNDLYHDKEKELFDVIREVM